jgi:hypothetical protein
VGATSEIAEISALLGAMVLIGGAME